MRHRRLIRVAVLSSILCSLLLVGSGAKQATVVLIEVTGVIDLGLAPFTRRALEEAEAREVAAVILWINTPGGRVDAAIEMRDALLDTKLDTIAFINKEAYSAGALIALAARKIYMTGGAVIGAAAPVDQQGRQVGEKHVSAIRKLFRATAERNGHPPEVAEAMVDADVAVPGLIEQGKLLTLTTQEALTWQVADGQVESLEELVTRLDLSPATLQHLRPNWAESLVRVLTQPSIAAMLLTIAFLGIWGEFLAPGFGLGGAIGVVSLALVLGSHYLVGLAGWEEMLLMGAGLVLLALELLVIPGFGVAGVLGILALGAGVFLSFLGNYPTADQIWRVVVTLLAVFVVVVAGAFTMLMLLPTTPVWRRLSLNTRLDAVSDDIPAEYQRSTSPLLGAAGVTLTPLMPSGTGLFGDKRLDIISEGAYIPARTPVTIIQVRGNRLVVRAQRDADQRDAAENPHGEEC